MPKDQITLVPKTIDGNKTNKLNIEDFGSQFAEIAPRNNRIIRIISVVHNLWD
jgi:hypothetical protein